MSNFYIGIDIGTSCIKTVVFDDHFNEVYIAFRKNYTISLQENGVEQDMDAIWLATLETLKEVLAESGVSPENFRAIGLTGQGEGLWLIDDKGVPVRHAILWRDGRAAEIVNELNEMPLLVQKIRDETGSTPIPCNTTMQLAWLARHEPNTLARARYILFAKDWIRFKLTGRIGLEYSDTGTSVLNLQQRTLSNTVFNILGLNKYRELFSFISTSCDSFAPLRPEIARATGIRANTVVCYGALDVSAAALGLGAVSHGDVFALMGTTCCTGEISRSIGNKNDGSRCVPHSLNNLFINLTATLNGTPNIDWCLNSIANTRDFAEIEQQISAAPAGAGGVLFHPYLSGERTPFYNENARASFFGINVNTSRQHLIRAVYEGVAFTIKDALHASPMGGKLFLAGGGTKSACWSQIIADITGRTVVCSSATELSARGAAILAAIACNRITTEGLQDCHLFTTAKSYSPSAENYVRYEELFKLYTAFRNNAGDLWNMRAQICKKVSI